MTKWKTSSVAAGASSATVALRDVLTGVPIALALVAGLGEIWALTHAPEHRIAKENRESKIERNEFWRVMKNRLV